MDRRAPRGGGRVRGQRAGAADRAARRLHGHRRPGLDPPAQRPLRRQEVARARCSRSAARCRARRSAATSSRRSTTTRCSPTSRSSARRSPPSSSCPMLIEQAGNAAIQERGVAVLTLPGDVGGLDLPKGTAVPRFVADAPARDAGARRRRSRRRRCSTQAEQGHAARRPRRARGPRRGARSSPSGCRRRWCSRSRPRRGSSDDNHFEVGQTGLIGNPATAEAFDGCDVLLMVGTDFPYRDLLPDRQDRGPARRPRRAHRPADPGRPRRSSATPASGCRRCSRCSRRSPTATTSTTARSTLRGVAGAAAAAHRPGVRPRSRRVCCGARSTTPTRGSVPSCSPPRSTGTRPRRDLHHRHRHVDGLALALRADERRRAG